VRARLAGVDAAAARRLLFYVLFLRGKEAAAQQRGYGVGALAARSFPGAAKQALLAVIGGAEDAREAIAGRPARAIATRVAGRRGVGPQVLMAPPFVDAAALYRLLAPPRDYAILQARLLNRPSAADVGFGRHTALDATRFMALMDRWIGNLRHFEAELAATLAAAASRGGGPWCRPAWKPKCSGYVQHGPFGTILARGIGPRPL